MSGAFHLSGQPRARLLLVTLVFALTMACWSSDSLFISLTATPIPVPTQERAAVDSLYQIGDVVLIASQGIGSVYLTVDPEPVTRRNRVPNAACYANSQVEITEVEQVDGVTYYRIECNNAPGWVAESSLSLPEGS